MGEEEKMNDLLATCGERVMGIKHQEQHEATSLEDAWKRSQIGWGSQINGNILKVSQSSRPQIGWGSQSNGHLVLVSQSSERRPQVLRTNTRDSYIDPTDDKDDMLGNVHLILDENDDESHGGRNGFVVPNMEGDQWINPTVVPYFTTDREDTVPRQFNGIEIRMKKQKNNTRGKEQKSKKGEIGLRASSSAEVLAKMLK
ncbi:uncharacterized protein FFMR_10210 [Fusarium fujikuroi]|nr:Uncharacterized protein Y057_13924 [Fusarium fujikuroi]SCN82468.1 uncharacterized protein FFC1_03902 [Fusarium fujikuroi]SCO50255.1 uncharacterized protein FFMR_10210 [Fusarium fujikuroi]SCO53321.1 uncharacterized protein FFNC_14763 [Fusarium fujikuroi]SCV59433.1 uncharacterized protein FFFS_14002 [Fusarium fujikuroi]